MPERPCESTTMGAAFGFKTVLSSAVDRQDAIDNGEVWAQRALQPEVDRKLAAETCVLQIEQRAPESPRAIAGWFSIQAVQSGLERRVQPAHPHRPNPQTRPALHASPRNEKTHLQRLRALPRDDEHRERHERLIATQEERLRRLIEATRRN